VEQLFVRSLAAPSAEQLTRTNQDVMEPYWSADGSRIYYTSKDENKKFGLWSIGVAGGAPELVFENAGGGDVSPDGKTQLLCMANEDRKISLWISSPPGSAPKKYTKGIFKDSWFDGVSTSFSPDGSRLFVQTRNMKEKFQYWVVPFPDGEPTRVESLDGVYTFGASWLPDNRRLIVSTRIPGGRPHLNLVDIENGTLQPITNSVTEEMGPDISPDGKRIVFSSSVQQYDLIEVPLDGAEVRSLTATPVNEKAPAWSSQGNQFAFVSDITGTDVIWVKNPTERLQRPLVTAKDFSDEKTDSFSRPFFSPDGKRIVYHRNVKSGMTDIWISSVSGGSPVRLFADEHAAQLAPSWSPDGNWIAFIRAVGDEMSLQKARIGSSDPPVLLQKDVYYLQPQWSPDGKWLMFLNQEGVSLISSDGQTSRKISNVPWLTGGWSLDGKTLYSIRQSETRRLLVMATNVETGQDTLIADAGVSPILVTDAVFAGFSLKPDGKSFATSILKSTSDLWILEDFNARPQSIFSFLKR
jgi:Tol biopolymer transport system component